MQFEGALRPMASLGFSTKDLDEVKGVFSDTSLYFLFVTFLVAALHVSPGWWQGWEGGESDCNGRNVDEDLETEKLFVFLYTLSNLFISPLPYLSFNILSFVYSSTCLFSANPEVSYFFITNSSCVHFPCLIIYIYTLHTFSAPRSLHVSVSSF